MSGADKIASKKIGEKYSHGKRAEV